MKWENLGTHRLSDLRVMSGDKINQKLRIFRIQKFFWFTFVFALVIGVLSFSGRQFLFNSQSSYVQKDPGIEYPQVISVGKPAFWKLKLKNTRRVWVSSTLIEKLSVEEVVPRPEKTVIVDQKLFITFKEPPEVIVLKVKPKVRGFIEGTVGGEREVFSVAFLAFP